MTVELESGLEYRRTFTMLSGDKREAIAAALSNSSGASSAGANDDSRDSSGDDSGDDSGDIQ